MTNKKILSGVLAIAISFYLAGVFFSVDSLAAAGFGESCANNDDCQLPLRCNDDEVCVRCTNDQDCGPSESCSRGACLGPDGIVEGDWCASDQQCQSEKCGSDNRCEATSENGSGDDGPLGNFPGRDFEFADLIGILTGFACWLGRIATAVMVIFIALAGFRFMLARADPKAFSGAVANLKTVLWGILVIYGAYVIIATVANAVGITDFSFIPLVC